MNYKVKIPREFKVKLSQRFDFKKAKKKKSAWGLRVREINIKCSLCKAFYHLYRCEGCPFAGFETTKSKGCFAWLDGVLPDHCFSSSASVWWKESDDIEVKEQLSLLRRKAKELIEWV